MEGREVTVIHRGGTTKRVEVAGFDDERRPVVLLRFWLAGVYRVNLNHGWVESPAADWRLVDADLAELRAWANANKRIVKPRPRAGKRPRKPKTGKPPHPKQTGFEWAK